ncbi:MAG: cytochrome-c peroxidase [Gammaproteobacteria bacterium]|nr:cytochrome-c peroxidase [Gammaproteobacteria bacterium]NNL45121.1 cytochrome-c peroxidase [Woeseiaceae bacterium]
MRSLLLKLGVVVVVIVVIVIGWQNRSTEPPVWTDAEIDVLRSLSLASLPALPPDPSNAVADNAQAAAFGERLFFDPRLSANGGIACSTCHQPARHFTDGLPKGQAIGTSKRNTPSIVGSAYSPWLYWDGRRDSQWAQALSPLEDPNEHGSSRLQVVAVIAGDDAYRSAYRALFGEFGDISGDDPVALNNAFANVGKAIAAFERTLLPVASRFDDYVDAVADGNRQQRESLFSDDEVWGLRLFIGEANCTQCHNGPLFTNNEFHNTGVLSSPGELPDKGRVAGVQEALADPFNCLGDHSDDPARQCAELTFVRTGPELIGAVRTPSLRNVELTAPYMHKGQAATLAEALRHYNEAPDAMIGHNEAKPLELSTRELRQVEAFLKTLTAPSVPNAI